MLLDADIEFDVTDAQTVLGREFGDGAPVWGVADAPTVLLHELGHLAGFDHSRVATAVMASGGGDVERQRRALTSDDVAGLCDAYPPSLGPQPSAACAPQPAIAPVVRLGGGGCSLSPGGAWSAPTVALVFLTEAWRASRRARGAGAALGGAAAPRRAGAGGRRGVGEVVGGKVRGGPRLSPGRERSRGRRRTAPCGP